MRFVPFLFTGFALFAASVPEDARAVLDAKCGSCHGDATGMSGFKVTSREAVLKGGPRGAGVTPGDAEASVVYQAVAQTGKLKMPPGGKLSGAEIETIRTWIEQGAGWPAGAVAQVKRPEWWAFQKPKKVTDAGAGVDFYLDRKIAAAKLETAKPADRLTLLRRGSYDLTGLAPDAKQIAAFLGDRSPGAWARAVDRMLASPQYGEKWGRYWLDLARYGDTSGFEQDPYILEGWRYRDYVIKSFNDDKPYDKFAKEQIAADELFPDDAEARTGTGFYRVGTNRDMLFKVEDLNAVERLTDAVDTTSAVFLGLTVGCARCHDHKFDPIPQKDYYRMQAVFAPAVNSQVYMEYNTARFSDLAANAREFRLRQWGEQIARMEKPYRKALREKKIAALPEAARVAVETDAKKRTGEQQSLVSQSADALKISEDEVFAALSQADAERMAGIERKLVGMFNGHAAPPMAPGIVDVGREAPRTYIAERGNYESPGEEVRPGFLTALGGGEVADPPLHAKTTYRRKALAEWIASPENALFARVMVNRIWQGHFGNGLVRTASDWGTRAGTASHPELLDWLAQEFVEGKWSVKAMHKLIMTSEAYQRSADATPSAAKDDPANVLLSHMSRRRLQSEEIRDSVLQVAGELSLKQGGPPVVPPLEAEELFGIIGKPENSWLVTPDTAEHKRRTVYMISRRTFQQPLFEAFDSPDGVQSCPRRNESTTAPQSLALLNSKFMVEEATHLAASVDTVDAAWERVLGRAPYAKERAAADEFLTKQTARLGQKRLAMTELVRGLMNLNEFLYVE
jgi:hypothetical protein